MNVLLHILFWAAAFGTVTSSIYCLMVVAAAVRFGLRRRREERDALTSTFLPSVSVLKPMHGTEEGLETNLETFFQQDYPDFELLFCARHETDPGLQLARKVGERYPDGVSQRQGLFPREA
jgi:ceramide glucosyltransferase